MSIPLWLLKLFWKKNKVNEEGGEERRRSRWQRPWGHWRGWWRLWRRGNTGGQRQHRWRQGEDERGENEPE
jgi:hypothetical protein